MSGLMTSSIKRWIALLAVGFLTACGGGGGGAAPFGGTSSGTGAGSGSGSGGTTGGTTTGLPTVVLTISSTTVRSTAPVTVTAQVNTAAGGPAAGQVVAFTTSGNLGVFSPATALTDASGVARVSLSPIASSSNGADLVLAKTTVGTSEVSGTIGFQVVPTAGGATGSPSIALSLSSTAVTTASPAILTAVVKDALGAPVAGQVVKFSTVDNLGTFNVGSALSDANGSVTARLSPASAQTSGADLAVVQVTVNGTLVTGTAGFSVASTGGAPVIGTPSIRLSLSNSIVTASSPASVTATVKDATGAGVAGQVVKFATVDGLGAFSVPSALTDANGVASVSLTATAGSSGADQVIATSTVNGATLQASQGFQLTAPNVSVQTLVADVGSNRLSAYGQTNLTVTVSGAASASPVQISLSSACVAKGRASLTPTSATTTTGTATFTYRDSGCGAIDVSDTIQASVTGSSAVQSLSIALTSPAVASINFVSASPSTIFLKGSGLTETATIVFRVLDTAGNGLPNQSVLVEPTTLTGGLTVDSGTQAVTKLSDSLGNVPVLINSGTVPTPVRVKATLVNSTISTVSSGLSVAVGLPSQLNFSLSQQTINIEGFNIDGTNNTYSIIASDRLANPVPAGTAINFVAEGGQIEASKLTQLTNGLARASANFVSASPRPADGRITVVAYALGEESFLDTNGNNIYDAGEQYQDLGNIYLNRRFNGVYDAANDQFIALSLPGSAAGTQACAVPSSDLLKGAVAIPSQPGTCDGKWGRAYVRRAAETVLSTSAARPLWFALPANLYRRGVAPTCSPLTLGTGFNAAGDPTSATLYPIGGGDLYGMQKVGVISFLASDANTVRLNPVAAGTVITVSSTSGLSTSVAGGSPVPSTAEATFVSINYNFDNLTTSGTLTVTFTSPGGLASSTSQFISLDAAPVGQPACP